MAHCVISAVVDTDNGNALVPARIVHTHYAPCPRDGEPAFPGPLHRWPQDPGDREKAVRMWRLRTRRQRPLVIHDMTRIGDVEDHVCEDEILPCPCNAEVLAAEEAA